MFPQLLKLFSGIATKMFATFNKPWHIRSSPKICWGMLSVMFLHLSTQVCSWGFVHGLNPHSPATVKLFLTAPSYDFKEGGLFLQVVKNRPKRPIPQAGGVPAPFPTGYGPAFPELIRTEKIDISTIYLCAILPNTYNRRYEIRSCFIVEVFSASNPQH